MLASETTTLILSDELGGLTLGTLDAVLFETGPSSAMYASTCACSGTGASVGYVGRFETLMRFCTTGCRRWSPQVSTLTRYGVAASVTRQATIPAVAVTFPPVARLS